MTWRRTWPCWTSSADEDYNHYPNGWAMAFNTPFKMWKRTSSTAAPPTVHHLLAATAGATAGRGEIRHQYTTPSTSCRPSWTPWGCRAPRSRPCAERFDGVSMRYSADMESAPSARKTSSTRCSAPAGSGTTAGKPSPPTHAQRLGHFNDDTWELYHTDTDRAELHDWPPSIREAPELVNLWFAEAGQNGPSRSMTGPPWRSSSRAAAAGRGARALRLLPGTRRCPSSRR